MVHTCNDLYYRSNKSLLDRLLVPYFNSSLRRLQLMIFFTYFTFSIRGAHKIYFCVEHTILLGFVTILKAHHFNENRISIFNAVSDEYLGA